MGLIEQKKADKRRRLIQSAYELFLEKGMSNTSIADICARSDIAKGTFYLYFKDKDDIGRAVNQEISRRITKNAFTEIEKDPETDYIRDFVNFQNRFIDAFIKNKESLKVLSMNYIWQVNFDDVLKADDEFSRNLKHTLSSFAEAKGVTADHVRITSRLLLEMTIYGCCNALINQDPLPVEELRAYLNEAAEGTLNGIH